MAYYVYLVKCADNTFYCGYTNDIAKRIEKHNTGKNGAKYTKRRRPVTLMYFEEYQALSEALKREYAIKKLSHAQKSLLNLRNGSC